MSGVHVGLRSDDDQFSPICRIEKVKRHLQSSLQFPQYNTATPLR